MIDARKQFRHLREAIDKALKELDSIEEILDERDEEIALLREQLDAATPGEEGARLP